MYFETTSCKQLLSWKPSVTDGSSGDFFLSLERKEIGYDMTPPPPELRKAANQVTIGCYDALVEVAHFTCSNWPPNAMVKAFNWHFNAFLRIVCRMQSYLCSTTEASSCGPAIHYTFNGIDLFS